MGRILPKSLHHTMLRWSDALSTRPIAALIFGLSIAALFGLNALKGNQPMVLKAVVHTEPVYTHSLLTTTVIAHHVNNGEHVTQGQHLLTLDTRATKRALELVEHDIAVLQAHLNLQAGQIQTAQQRDAFDTLRTKLQLQQDLHVSRTRTNGLGRAFTAASQWRNNVEELVKQGTEPRSALLEAEKELADARALKREAQTRATTSLHNSNTLESATPETNNLLERQQQWAKASIALLSKRREHLHTDLKNAVIRAQTDGRIAFLAPIGSRADTAHLVSITQEQSHRLIAYMPPGYDPAIIPKPEQTARPRSGCQEAGHVIGVGAMVEKAPEYMIGNQLGVPLYGLPIYIELPKSCAMKPGFVLQIEIHP